MKDERILNEFCSIAETIECKKSGDVLHKALAIKLAENGFAVTNEAFVPFRGPEKKRSGRIDIVAHKDGTTIACEVDTYNPKKKSIYKLQNYKCDFKVCLSATRVIDGEIDGIDRIIRSKQIDHIIFRVTSSCKTTA
jgi:hypothetical protein